MLRKVNKLWGSEQVLIHTDLYSAKIMILIPGYQSSLHCHREKQETFYVIEGEMELDIENPAGELNTMVLKQEEQITLYPHCYHRFRTKSSAKVLEVSTRDKPEDNYRKEESRPNEDACVRI